MSRPTTAPSRGPNKKAAGKTKQRPDYKPLVVHSELQCGARPYTAPAVSNVVSRYNYFRKEAAIVSQGPVQKTLRVHVSGCPSFLGSSVHVFNSVPSSATVAQLKKLVYERIMLTPNHALHLSSWGRMLDDHLTLADAKLPNEAKLQMHLTLARPDAERGLSRVRVASTCLRTQQVTVNEKTTVSALKARLAEFYRHGEHSWHTADVSALQCSQSAPRCDSQVHLSHLNHASCCTGILSQQDRIYRVGDSEREARP